MAIAGVGSFSRSLTDGLGARRPRHPRRRSGFHADPSRGRRRGARFLDAHGQVSVAATLARDGAHRRRPQRAGRDQGRRCNLSAVRHGRARSRHAACRRARRRATAPSAPPSIQRCWRGSTSSAGARITIGGATFEIRAAHQDRAGQARQRHRLRPSRDHQRGCAARHRPAAAGQPGALDLSPAAAGRQRPRRRRGDRGRERATSGCRLADPRRAPTRRRRWNATSSTSPNFSRWSA